MNRKLFLLSLFGLGGAAMGQSKPITYILALEDACKHWSYTKDGIVESDIVDSDICGYVTIPRVCYPPNDIRFGVPPVMGIGLKECSRCGALFNPRKVTP